MLFVLHALDRPGALPKRLANYDAHKAFLADTSPHGVTILMSGPLTADDGQTMIGSLFLHGAVLRLLFILIGLLFALAGALPKSRSAVPRAA